MSDMIERVARALCWNNGMNPDLTLGGDDENFLWHEYVSGTRAAIAAMREPTEIMILAGVHHENMGNMAGRWQAMIDAALAEETPE